MSKVLVHVTMSVDGYMAGPDISLEDPMGRGGERLHEWVSSPDPVDAEVIASLFAETGAVVLGRRTFDVGLPQWEDTPFPAPSFVVTHRPHDPLTMKSSTFTFVPALGEALEAAARAAGDKTVVLMGAAIMQQALAAGLVDELQLQIAPLMLGEGTPLFTGVGSHDLEPVDVRRSAHVTHLRYRIAPGV